MVVMKPLQMYNQWETVDQSMDIDNLANENMSIVAISECIKTLCDPLKRESALMILSKRRELIADLAVMLWYSFGSVAALLEEVVSVYSSIIPPTLSALQSNRVCNALALLQCIASHPDTRHEFMNAKIPLFLYPFLHTSCKTRPFEYLRLTSLGVIGALVKTDEHEVIAFLINTEIIPLCLRIMENGSELSKTVATFILQKVLADDSGLQYICHTYERFSHVAMILGRMVLSLAKDQCPRLLKHVIRCYLRLSENHRAREALRSCLPDNLKNNTFARCLQSEPLTRRWLQQLLQNIERESPVPTPVCGNGGTGISSGSFSIPNVGMCMPTDQNSMIISNSGNRNSPGSIQAALLAAAAAVNNMGGSYAHHMHHQQHQSPHPQQNRIAAAAQPVPSSHFLQLQQTASNMQQMNSQRPAAFNNSNISRTQ
ncbi:hypothetical protein GJ496_002447 [Pomphorhynchus laevis]|nr:hypothetical protein GJ496_002447 [Pomphorhynchus laevis]